MRKLPALALGGLALALAGGALAASQQTHRMDVPLPDGGMVQIDYVGDVAPKVSVAPAEPRGLWAPMAFPGFGNFGNFDGMFEQMDRQMRQMQQMASHPGAPGMNVAGYMPAGSSSVSVVSTSNNGVSCTRTTEVMSQGAGKPPKVTTNVSGDCAGAPRAPQAAPSGGSGPIDHT